MRSSGQTLNARGADKALSGLVPYRPGLPSGGYTFVTKMNPPERGPARQGTSPLSLFRCHVQLESAWRTSRGLSWRGQFRAHASCVGPKLCMVGLAWNLQALGPGCSRANLVAVVGVVVVVVVIVFVVVVGGTARQEHRTPCAPEQSAAITGTVLRACEARAKEAQRMRTVRLKIKEGDAQDSIARGGNRGSERLKLQTVHQEDLAWANAGWQGFGERFGTAPEHMKANALLARSVGCNKHRRGLGVSKAAEQCRMSDQL